MRIYTLAKELQIDSKELVDICIKAGVPGVGSALASVTEREAEMVRQFLNKGSGGITSSGGAAVPAHPNNTGLADDTRKGPKVPVPSGFVAHWGGKGFGFIRPDDEMRWRQTWPEIYSAVDAHCRAKAQPFRVYFNFLDIDDEQLADRLNSMGYQQGLADELPVEFELRESFADGQLTYKAINVRGGHLELAPRIEISSLKNAEASSASTAEVVARPRLESQKAYWYVHAQMLKEADELRFKARDAQLQVADRIRYCVDLIRHMERYPILFDASARAAQVREIGDLTDPEIEWLRQKYSRTKNANGGESSKGDIAYTVRGLDLSEQEFERIEPFMSANPTICRRIRDCWADIRQFWDLWRDFFEPEIGDLQSDRPIDDEQWTWALRGYVFFTLLNSRFPGRHTLHVTRANCARVVARYYAGLEDLQSSARWLQMSYFANRSAFDLVASSDEYRAQKTAGIMSAILAEDPQKANRLPALAIYWRKQSGAALQPLSRLSLLEANLLYANARMEWQDAPLTATDRLLHVLSNYPDHIHAIRLLPKSAAKAGIHEETLSLIDHCIPETWLENRLVKALLYEVAATQADAAVRLQFLNRCQELLRELRNHDPGHSDIAELQIRIDRLMGTLADRPLPIPGLIGGKYQQDRNGPMRLGMFGRCYRVTNVLDHKYYFIKEFDPAHPQYSPAEVRQQAQREFHAGRSTKHPSIVRAIELVDSKYLVMEWIHGVDLADYTRGDGVSFRFSGQQVAVAGKQLCDALDHLGKVWPREIVNPRLPNLRPEDVAHGDIRPQNIRYDQDHEQYVLIDFTLARLDDVASVPSALIAGIIKEEYRAPEQFETSGHRRNCLTDIYSLGMVLYRLYTGRFPYYEGPTDLLKNIENPPQPIPPSEAISQLATSLGVQIPKGYIIREVDEILCRMVQVEPDKRYRRPSEARDAFAQIVSRNDGQ